MTKNAYQDMLENIENMMALVDNARTNVMNVYSLLRIYNANQDNDTNVESDDYQIFLNTVFEQLQNSNQCIDQLAFSDNLKSSSLLKSILNPNAQKREKRQAIDIEEVMQKYEEIQSNKKRALVTTEEESRKKVKLEQALDITTFNDDVNLDAFLNEVTNKEKNLSLLSIKHCRSTNNVYLFIKLSCTFFFSILLNVPGHESFNVSTQKTSTYSICDVKFYAQSEREEMELHQLTKHRIFQKLNGTVMEAIEFYFATEEFSNHQLQTLLLYIVKFERMFVEKCTHCFKLLKIDSSKNGFLPPSVRSYATFKPYHSRCIADKNI
ncbi:SETD5 [Acrasis kona]|uniref:SETD5 n=1 Tax=Acrasis kona TaxID=1008807 RepID=A0AAW2YT93_9EUKA